ncbi:MAG: rhomboid family intramembrane serine protease [Thermodesulfobacteriota bacterium]
MFPIRDYIPRRHAPYGTRTLVAINILFFIYEMGLDKEEMTRLFYLLGVVPARYFHPEWAEWVGYTSSGLYPFLTHMFLHSGFFHFVANMWILWIFADNVEDVMGPLRFAAFYLCCGLIALAGHMFFNSDSTVPVVGASGAIAGVMGAYLILYPRATVLTLVPILFFPLFIDLPAVIFLGIWFLIQLFSGLAAAVGQSAAGVAWWAHAAGFIAGVLLLPFFKNSSRLTPDRFFFS